MPHCTKCGTEVAEGAAFCPKCGEAQGTGSAAPGQTTSSSGGLEPNIAAALAYLWIVAIIWLVMEPYNKDKFIRFHSFQALGFGVVVIIGNVVLSVIPFFGWALLPLWGLAAVLAWLFLMFKAFNKEKFKLPVIGDFAEQQAAKG